MGVAAAAGRGGGCHCGRTGGGTAAAGRGGVLLVPDEGRVLLLARRVPLLPNGGITAASRRGVLSLPDGGDHHRRMGGTTTA